MSQGAKRKDEYFCPVSDLAERKACLEFNEDDVARLNTLHEELKPVGREFVRRLYAFYRRFGPTRGFFKDKEQVARLQNTQSSYFDGLTAGDYGEDYALNRLKIGAVHERIGLAPKWYLSAYRRYFIELATHLAMTRDDNLERFIEEFSSLTKVIFLDMGLALDAYYQTAGEREKRQRQRLANILQQLSSGVLIVDDSYRVTEANPAAKKILQINDSCVGQPLGMLLPVCELNELVDLARIQGHVRRDVTLPMGQHTTRYLSLSITRLDSDADNDTAKELLVAIEDFTELRRVEDESLRLASTDVLTGLANRVQLAENLRRDIAQAKRNKNMVGVAFLDLDRFKVINDTLGHAAGDRLLQELAKRLKNRVRETDTIARFGGDEFVFVFNDLSSRKDCEALLNELLQVFDEPFVLENREYSLGGSIGAAMYPGDAKNQHTLLKYADAAMFLAKGDTRQRYCFFNPMVHNATVDNLHFEQQLRKAVERKEFSVHYQPTVDLGTLEIIGFEALMRWESSDLGTVSPDRFIPLLEETRMIVAVGQWVLREACETAARWNREHEATLTISVNIASQQLHDPDFSTHVFLTLLETGLEPACLEIELTESTLIQRTGTTVENLNTLHEMGIRLAVDDFGTGYSSLSYLKQFPIDRLKIDRSFISGIEQNEDSEIMAQAIVNLGKTLQLQVTAEGVENTDQLTRLRQWGCDVAQGYYFSKAERAEEVEKLLKKPHPFAGYEG